MANIHSQRDMYSQLSISSEMGIWLRRKRSFAVDNIESCLYLRRRAFFPALSFFPRRLRRLA